MLGTGRATPCIRKEMKRQAQVLMNKLLSFLKRIDMEIPSYVISSHTKETKADIAAV
jgi:hypothetical protein